MLLPPDPVMEADTGRRVIAARGGLGDARGGEVEMEIGEGMESGR